MKQSIELKRVRPFGCIRPTVYLLSFFILLGAAEAKADSGLNELELLHITAASDRLTMGSDGTRDLAPDEVRQAVRRLTRRAVSSMPHDSRAVLWIEVNPSRSEAGKVDYHCSVTRLDYRPDLMDMIAKRGSLSASDRMIYVEKSVRQAKQLPISAETANLLVATQAQTQLLKKQVTEAETEVADLRRSTETQVQEAEQKFAEAKKQQEESAREIKTWQNYGEKLRQQANDAIKNANDAIKKAQELGALKDVPLAPPAAAPPAGHTTPDPETAHPSVHHS